MMYCVIARYSDGSAAPSIIAICASAEEAEQLRGMIETAQPTMTVSVVEAPVVRLTFPR